MKNLPQLWKTFQAARQWNKRPCEVLGILEDSMEQDGGYTAFCFDEACSLWGNTLSMAMDTAKGKTDAQRRGNAENILRRYLGLPQKFRDIGEAAKAKKADRPDPPFRMEH